MVKKTVFGKVQKNVQGFDIRNIPVSSGHGKDRKVTSSSLGVFKGKKLQKSGFKNVQEAETYIVENLLKGG